MLEIRLNQDAELEFDYELFVDGERIAKAGVSYDDTNSFDVKVYKLEDVWRVAEHIFSDIPLEIESLELWVDFDWSEMAKGIKLKRIVGANTFEIGLKFGWSFEAWKGWFSFAEYAATFEEIVTELNNPQISWKQNGQIMLIDCWLTTTNSSPNRTIKDQILAFSQTASDLHKKVLQRLESQVTAGSLVTSFNFPEEVRIPCEQYLLYFIQFLKDLGVAATSKLTHEADQVLFTITPTNKQVALDNIRIALNDYLRLPAHSLVGFSDAENEIAIQRLVAEIHHFKSQLYLAQAMLQAKEVTIQANELIIGHQQRLLNGEIMIDSLKTPIKENEPNKEEILDGFIKITSYKGRFFELDVPKMVKYFKRIFTDKNL